MSTSGSRIPRRNDRDLFREPASQCLCANTSRRAAFAGEPAHALSLGQSRGGRPSRVPIRATISQPQTQQRLVVFDLAGGLKAERAVEAEGDGVSRVDAG